MGDEMRSMIPFVVVATLFFGCASKQSDPEYLEYLNAVKSVYTTGPPVLVELEDGTKIYDPRGIPNIRPPERKKNWHEWVVPLTALVLTTGAQAYIAHENGKTSRAWTDALINFGGAGSAYIMNSYNRTDGDESPLGIGATDVRTNDGIHIPGHAVYGDGNVQAGRDIIPGTWVTNTDSSDNSDNSTVSVDQSDHSDNSVTNPPQVVQVEKPLVLQPEIVDRQVPVLVDPFLVTPEVVQVPQCPPTP